MDSTSYYPAPCVTEPPTTTVDPEVGLYARARANQSMSRNSGLPPIPLLTNPPLTPTHRLGFPGRARPTTGRACLALAVAAWCFCW